MLLETLHSHTLETLMLTVMPCWVIVDIYFIVGIQIIQSNPLLNYVQYILKNPIKTHFMKIQIQTNIHTVVSRKINLMVKYNLLVHYLTDMEQIFMNHYLLKVKQLLTEQENVDLTCISQQLE